MPMASPWSTRTTSIAAIGRASWSRLPRRCRSADQPQPQRDRNRMHAVGGVELVHCVLRVGAHRRGREVQLLADDVGGQALGEVLQDLPLARAELNGDLGVALGTAGTQARTDVRHTG